MKKRIFSLLLVILLMITVLFTLTACGDDDDENGKKKTKASTSSAEDTIEAVVDAINEKDASALMDLIDFKAIEKTNGDDIDKKEFKSSLKDFFDKYDDLEIKVSKIQYLEEDDDLMDSLLDSYDSYDEYIEEIEDEYDIKNISIYSAKLKVSDEYEDLFDNSAISKGKDVIYLTENDGEYKIIYSMFSLSLYSDYAMDFDDYDDDEYNYDDDDDNDNDDDSFDLDDMEIQVFNQKFEVYEGTQVGTNVSKLIDNISDNNKTDSGDHPVYLSYYDENGSIDEIMITDEKDLKELKNKIDATHKYTVEVEEDYAGYIRYIDLKY